MLDVHEMNLSLVPLAVKCKRFKSETCSVQSSERVKVPQSLVPSMVELINSKTYLILFSRGKFLCKFIKYSIQPWKGFMKRIPYFIQPRKGF